MNRRRVAVGAIGVACAVVLASPLAAAPNGKRPIQIDSFTVGVEGGDGSFYLSFGSGGYVIKQGPECHSDLLPRMDSK